jgi:cyclase
MKNNPKKIIICLDIKDGKVSKGVQFENVISLGDPVEMAENYSKQAVDELVFYDIMASA